MSKDADINELWVYLSLL